MIMLLKKGNLMTLTVLTSTSLLSSDLWLKIFVMACGAKNLNAIAAVCKHWNSIVYEQRFLFISTLYEKKFHKVMSEEPAEVEKDLPLLALLSTKLNDYALKLQLSIDKLGTLSDETLLSCLKRFAYTRSLELEGLRASAVTEKGFAEIGTILKGLRHLKLNDNSSARILIEDREFESIVSQNPKLHSLDISGCCKLTPSSLVAVSKKTRKLETCHFSSDTWLTDVVITAFVNDHPNLKSLGLSGRSKLSNQALAAIEAHATQLTKFELFSLPFDKASLFSCLGKMKNLASFLLWNTLDDEDVKTIAKNCPQLTHCNLRRWKIKSLSTLKDLGKQCPHLKELTLCIDERWNLKKDNVINKVSSLRKKYFQHLTKIDVNSKEKTWPSSSSP